MAAPSARWAPIAVIQSDRRRLLPASVSVFVLHPGTYFWSRIVLPSAGAEHNSSIFAMILFILRIYSLLPSCFVCYSTLCVIFFCLSLLCARPKAGVGFSPPHCCRRRVGQQRFPSSVGRSVFLHQPEFQIPIGSETFFFSSLSRFKPHVYCCLLSLWCCINEQFICSHYHEWVCVEY